MKVLTTFDKITFGVFNAQVKKRYHLFVKE
jgi:hypothetical protein